MLADRLMGKTGEAGAQNGHGWANGNGSGHTKASGLAWCDIHDCAMTRYERNGRSWYSRTVEGGKWCKER